MTRTLSLLCALILCLAMTPLCAWADRAYFLDSDTRRITESELWEWDRESLSFMFNEIFARHGFTFDVGGKFYNWFNNQPWYQLIAKVDDQTAYARTTQLEWDNYHTIKRVIAKMEASGHPYRKSPGSNLKSWIDNPPPGNWSLTGFQVANIRGEQKLNVYSAPSTASWRGANGRAMVNTSGGVWAAGWENGWLLVFYETNAGSVRVGYVNGNTISGPVTTAWGTLNDPLFFSRQNARLTANCQLTDDPVKNASAITSLRSGGTVKYLTTVINQYGRVWDYIETSVSGQTVRGYIPSGCLKVPADTLPNLDSYAK